MYNRGMIAVKLYLPQPVNDALREIAKREDVSFSEIVRRAVIEYITNQATRPVWHLPPEIRGHT